MDPAQLARITFWVEAYSRSIENLRQSFILALLRIFMRRGTGLPTPRGIPDLSAPTGPGLPFDAPLAEQRAALLGAPKLSVWYDDAATQTVARQAAALSQTTRQAVDGLSGQYVANVVAEMTDTAPLVKRVEVPPIRNGADMTEVYARPVEAFRRRMSTTGDEQIATHAALARADELADGDVMLRSRDAEVTHLRAHGITRYRRVLHPERSESGLSCGMCIAASTRIYTKEDLQPMHIRCRCTVLPIEGSLDPGAILNAQDRALLDRLYREAGGTSAQKLFETRYHVNEHGEYGPVLTRRGTPFNTPKQIGQADPIGRAVRELEKLRPTLVLLENKAAAGQDVTDALSYQRDRIAYLTRIVEAA